MSMSFGGGDANDAGTLRGRGWPCLRQFCVFMENRVGRLQDLLRQIERHDLRVIALSIADSVDCVIARIMLDNTDRGREIFDLSDLPYSESDLVGVELPEDHQPFVRVCTALLEAEVNIHYTYPLLYRRRGKGAIALYVDDIDQALSVLKHKGHRIITENDLREDDEHFS